MCIVSVRGMAKSLLHGGQFPIAQQRKPCFQEIQCGALADFFTWKLFDNFEPLDVIVTVRSSFIITVRSSF